MELKEIKEDLTLGDFIKLYMKVHDLHHRLFNTWLLAWEDKGIHYLRLGDENEISGIIVEHVYEMAYDYMLELNAKDEEDNLEFRKGWDSYEPTPLSVKGVKVTV